MRGLDLENLTRDEMLDLLKGEYSKCIKSPENYSFTKGLYYRVIQEGANDLYAADDNGVFFCMTFDDVDDFFEAPSERSV